MTDWTEHRKVLEVERRRRARVRQDLQALTSVHTAYRGEHRAVLEGAIRMSREGLDAHRKALQENAWLLKLVALYERLQQVRAQRARAKARPDVEAKPAGQPAVAQT